MKFLLTFTLLIFKRCVLYARNEITTQHTRIAQTKSFDVVW
jgi:hypothetical protein